MLCSKYRRKISALPRYGGSRRFAQLTARNRQNRHDLYGFARKNREMRMVLEQLGSRLVGFGAHDHEGAQLVTDVLYAARSDFLGLSERPTRAGNHRVMLLHPSFPGSHALLFLGAPFGL